MDKWISKKLLEEITKSRSPGKHRSGLISKQDWLIWSRYSSRDYYSSTTIKKHQLFSAFFMNQLSHVYMTTGKTIYRPLTIQTFVSKVMPLVFNTLSRLVIAFLPRRKHLLISRLQLPSTVILEPQKVKPATISTFSSIYLPWSYGTRCHGLSLLNVEF